MFITFLCTFYVVMDNCKTSKCDHDPSKSLLVVQSLCKLEIDGIYKGNGVFISRNKVLTIALILYKFTASKKPIESKRIKVLLPSSEAPNTNKEFNVNRLIIPDKYKHPSYKFNFAILIVSYY